eukprot:GHRQ01029917.1.p1 GENE.GHRQ01029917.1~~GHRQ01029917.1.p1  ORF type:complete len:253 (+),score=48.14 GHRQ01029917.1:114-872(+)
MPFNFEVKLKTVTMLGPSCSVRAAGVVLAAPLQTQNARAARGCKRRVTCVFRASPSSSVEFDDVEGDTNLQDALLQQLRVQVDSQVLKEEIKEDLRERVEGLKQIGEEVGSKTGCRAACSHSLRGHAHAACVSIFTCLSCALLYCLQLIQQLDEELGIEKFRTELESTQVLSDANEKLNELEEQLQVIKEQIKVMCCPLRIICSSLAMRPRQPQQLGHLQSWRSSPCSMCMLVRRLSLAKQSVTGINSNFVL